MAPARRAAVTPSWENVAGGRYPSPGSRRRETGVIYILLTVRPMIAVGRWWEGVMGRGADDGHKEGRVLRGGRRGGKD